MIRKAILCLMLLIGAMTMNAATNAATGSSCYDAIPLVENYSEIITNSKTVWYVAKTFDLPVKVCFTPQNINLPPPDVEMDFTCRPGVYEDSILNSLFGKDKTTGIEFTLPHTPTLQLEEGEYCISMGAKYRDLLLQAGISYNVDVYVKVTFNSPGTLSMVPDTEFSDCMDGGKFTQLGDTINVLPNDKDRYVILPYIQWTEDSIRYIWQGTAPVEVVIANTCGIDLTDYTDERIIDRFEMKPGDTVSFTAEQIKHYANFVNVQAGMSYGKFYSNGTGFLTIERVPVAPPDGGAVLLKYDKPTTIMANDINALYALRRDTVAIRFDSPTNHVMRMYIGTSANFTPETAVASYTYYQEEDGQQLRLLRAELDQLWSQTTSNYLYVRFATTARTTVTPSVWIPSECMLKWKEIQAGNVINTVRFNAGPYYRIAYSQWVGGDMTLALTGTNVAVPVFIGDTCGFQNNNKDPHVIYAKSVPKRSSITIPASEIETWADRVDDEGNIYIIFGATQATQVGGTFTVTSTAPLPQDPVYPSATIAITCVDENNKNIQVSVSQSQTITIINSMDGATVQQWEATIDSPKNITLPTGIYTLQGATETVTLQVD